jgi:hypothetical protein
MAKSRKQAAEPAPPIVPRIGDKVTIPRIESVLEVHQVSRDGTEVTLQRPGTNLQWFRIKADTLTYVDRKPPAKTSNPFTTPEAAFDADEALERIAAVQEENLKRFDNDIAILKKYLTTQDVPKGVIGALEGISSKQQEIWRTAIERIEDLLKE